VSLRSTSRSCRKILCCRGELHRRLRQGAVKCGDFAAAFAALPGKGEQIGFLSSDDRRPLSEFHHIGGMIAVEIFGFLLEQPEFDREFGPQQSRPRDFLGRKRKLAFRAAAWTILWRATKTPGRSRER